MAALKGRVRGAVAVGVAVVALLLAGSLVTPAAAQSRTVGAITITRRADGLLVRISTRQPAPTVTFADFRAGQATWGRGEILVAPASFGDFSGGLETLAGRGGRPGFRGALGSSADRKLQLTYYTLADGGQVVLFDQRQSLRQVNTREYTLDTRRTPALAAVWLTRAQAAQLLQAFRAIRS